jgi:MerR HTH family regulatory protein
VALLRFRTDAPGYLLDGEPFDRFPDQPELPARQRQTIARWAERFDPNSLTDEQRELLASRPPRRASQRQRELLANRDDLRELVRTGLWDALAGEEREWVRQPRSHPSLEAVAGYPLSVSEVGRVTGASERQLRHWIDNGLVPAVREGEARRIYSAGLAHALLLAQQGQPEKTVLTRVLDGQAGTFLGLLGASLDAWARGKGPESRDEVADVVDGLSRLARLTGPGAADVAPRPRR